MYIEELEPMFKKATKKFKDLDVGEAFYAKNHGLFIRCDDNEKHDYNAINLHTGTIEYFYEDFKVNEVDAKISYIFMYE